MEREQEILKKISLLEKELATLTEKLDEACCGLKDLEDLKLDIKGLKLFLGRTNPDFKNQYPEITKKLSGKTGK